MKNLKCNKLKKSLTFPLFYILDGDCPHWYDSTAFLFSLVNKLGWGPQILYQTGYRSRDYRGIPLSYSIISCKYGAPIFGSGYDLYIASDASSNTDSYTDLGNTYGPPTGSGEGSSDNLSFLAGSHKFQPDEVEVFYKTA